MLKLFRKIRQNLLLENKFSKYLIYAIGEVALVMIGILMALQVNNWNEGRKEVQREIKILYDLHSDIIKNINNIKKGVTILEEGKQKSSNILSAFENQTNYDSSINEDLSFYRYFWDPDFTYASFENLKFEGVNLIANDTLRNKIIELFEVDMDILDVSDLNRHDSFISTVGGKSVGKHLYYDWRTSAIVTFDYERMISDNEFYSFATFIFLDQKTAINKFKQFIKNAKLINEDIEKEIQHLQ